MPPPMMSNRVNGDSREHCFGFHLLLGILWVNSMKL